MKEPHIPVLSKEILDYFSSVELRYYLDGTLGAGGHAEQILRAHPEIEIFVGIDQDPQALEIASKRLEPWRDKTIFFHGNFSDINRFTEAAKITSYDGMLFDLGVSSMQLDIPEKGFSFMRDGPLDMRMNPKQSLTAAEVVNTFELKELGKIFRDYGEEKQWKAVAKAIVTNRTAAPINTTFDLVNVLKPIFPFYKKKGVNPMTLIFQGLRIYVNRELDVLEEMLPQAINLLAPQGRMGVISFHSLEDRIVKKAFQFSASDKYDTSGIGGVFLDKEPAIKLLSRKPITATEDELRLNPRSRSAKLRFIEKL